MSEKFIPKKLVDIKKLMDVLCVATSTDDCCDIVCEDCILSTQNIAHFKKHINQ